jgi:hypothetical protein
MKMKNTFFNYIKITLALLFFSQVGEVSAQSNLTMNVYGINGFNNLDVTVLDQIFGTVTVNGTVRTTDFDFGTSLISALPTTAAGFGGVQVVMVVGYNTLTISTAQADALIAFVKGGGILIGSIEGTTITSTGGYAIKYIGEALLCNTATLTPNATKSPGILNAPAFHPGNGAMLLNTGATSVKTTTDYSTITGVPSANIIYANSTVASCSALPALDFIVPAYPGTFSNCGVNGMAIFSGEVQGPLLASGRDNTQGNINYAQLLYDFLYVPSAMKTRRAWSTISTNTNTTCPPALPPCNAGTTAPSLSKTTIDNNSCTPPYINLNSVVSSTPTGASLVWYTNNTRTGNPVLDPTKVEASGTYYAFFYDATNNCYSPASAAVVATYTPCPYVIPPTVCPATSFDLASIAKDTPPVGYVYTYHDGTPATAANKISSIVTATGNYYVGMYAAAQMAYAPTSRPVLVKITACCRALFAPDLTN